MGPHAHIPHNVTAVPTSNAAITECRPAEDYVDAKVVKSASTTTLVGRTHGLGTTILYCSIGRGSALLELLTLPYTSASLRAPEMSSFSQN